MQDALLSYDDEAAWVRPVIEWNEDGTAALPPAAAATTGGAA